MFLVLSSLGALEVSLIALLICLAVRVHSLRLCWLVTGVVVESELASLVSLERWRLLGGDDDDDDLCLPLFWRLLPPLLLFALPLDLLLYLGWLSLSEESSSVLPSRVCCRRVSLMIEGGSRSWKVRSSRVS